MLTNRRPRGVKSLLMAAGFGGLLAAVAMLPVLASPGVVPDINFEIDGDIPPVEGTDWGNAQYPPANFIVDPHSKSAVDSNIFKPAGKFETPAAWSILPGSVGSAQAELTNIFVWAIAPGDVEVSEENKNTDSWLVMGMERTKKEGTFALDFEFNQKGWDGKSGTLVRTPGDLAVGYELKGNPVNPLTDLQVLIVVYDPNKELPNEKCLVTYGQGGKVTKVVRGANTCPPYGASGWYYRFLANAEILDLDGYGEATMNPVGFAAPPGTPPGYQSFNAQGTPDAWAGPFEFAEAAVNLTAMGLDPGCPGFGTVHAKSRSSLEVGSDLKDLAGPQALPVRCYVEGYKYLDVNGNGTRDAGEPTGEPGLNGWTIELTGDSSQSVVTENDADGNPGYYRFDNLADGSYTVSEECPVATPPWVQTEPSSAGCGAGEHTFDIDINNRIGVGNFGNGAPAIDVTKTCTDIVEVGQPITYAIGVENTGNVDLVNVIVQDLDPLVDFEATETSLVVEQDKSYSVEVNAPPGAQTIDNTVTATGDYGAFTVFATVDDSATCTTTVVDARISISPDATNEIGTPHTFTVFAEKNEGGEEPAWQPADDGTTVTVALTDTHGAAHNISVNNCSTGTVGGYCTVTFTSNSAGTVTGHASATIMSGGLPLVRETDGQAGNSDDAEKIFVDAKIAISPDDTNSIGEAHTFTVLVQKNEGQGADWVPAANNTIVTVTLTGSGGASAIVSSNTCASPGTTAGYCSVTFTSNTAGTIIGHASATIMSGGLGLLRQTNGVAGNSGDATKVFVSGSLRWTKYDDKQAPLAGATFRVCRTHDRFGVDIPDECVSVVDNSAPDANPAGGQFFVNNRALGRYTLEETVAPNGFIRDTHVETVELTLALPNVIVSYVWVNQKPNQGCTPGFWQGGAGAPLWDQVNDPQWTYDGTNPFIHTTFFNTYFNGTIDSRLNGLTMYELVSSGGTSDSARRAARDMVAAYLNESAIGTGYPATSLAALTATWYSAVAGGDPALDAFHSTVGGWNSPAPPGYCPLP